MSVCNDVDLSNVCMINLKKLEEPAVLYPQGKLKPQDIQKLIASLDQTPHSAHLVLDFGFPIFLDRVCLRGLRA